MSFKLQIETWFTSHAKQFTTGGEKRRHFRRTYNGHDQWPIHHDARKKNVCGAHCDACAVVNRGAKGKRNSWPLLARKSNSTNTMSSVFICTRQHEIHNFRLISFFFSFQYSYLSICRLRINFYSVSCSTWCEKFWFFLRHRSFAIWTRRICFFFSTTASASII